VGFLSDQLAGLPFMVTVRFSKPQCDWLARYFRNIERWGVIEPWHDQVKNAVVGVYSQFRSTKKSCQFTFCADEFYFGKFGYDHLVPLSEARELRHALVCVLKVRCISRPMRAAFEQRLRAVDDILRTNPVDRLGAIAHEE
jgi:hypothetical protein